jgi:SAM-dependent methyltransferase
MKPGATVLDVGAGRRPVIPLEEIRDTYYVALDVDAEELEAAPEGLYKESVVSPIETYQPQLANRFDLVASFYVFEHVRSLETAIENCRLYLKPGGTMVTQFSGRFSYFAVANQVIPHAVTRKLGKVLAGREPHTIFPAFYNNCWYGAVAKLMHNWREVEIRPLYTGAGYLDRKPFALVKPAYLASENWTERGTHKNLASHYLVVAKK